MRVLLALSVLSGSLFLMGCGGGPVCTVRDVTTVTYCEPAPLPVRPVPAVRPLPPQPVVAMRPANVLACDPCAGL